MQTGAIILCGGKSSRMGRDKATLPFGPELMLPRTIRLLSEVVDPRKIVIVSAPDQQLPPLPQDVTVARDQRQGRGPLEGLSAGLEAIPCDVEAAYVTSCDVPLLVPAFVIRMFELLEDFDIAVPWEGEQFHPLAAVYRPLVSRFARKLLLADQLRLRFLFDEAKTRRVDVEQLRAVDPELRTLVNLNHPEDYQAALKIAGYSDVSNASSSTLN
jgi:molybdopterin-guanine dinucleotide biosynthesis protein A